MLKLVGVHSWIELLSAPVRHAVLKCMQARRYSDGAAIYRARQPSTEMFQVRSGMVRIGSEGHAGTEFAATLYQPGDCFGDVDLIDGLPRFNSTYAVGDAELLVLRKADFTRLRRAHPEIHEAVLLSLCYRMRIAFSMLEDASVLTLKQRLARLLLRLASSFGEPRTDGTTTVPDISHQEIADMLGTTRQGVSRALKELEHEGGIQLNYRRIVIRQPAELEKGYEALLGGEAIVPDYRRKKP